MSNASPSPNVPSQYELNKELYESSMAIRNEMNLLAERIAKMEEHKQEISEAVYIRVKSDYLARHDLAKKSFEEKKREIQKALRILYKGKTEQEAELQRHREILEEARFRHVLGELADEKKEEIANRENVEIARFESIVSVIQSNVQKYEELNGGPTDEASEVPSLKAEPAVAPPALPKSASPVAENTSRIQTSPPSKTAEPPKSSAAKPTPPAPKQEEEDYFLGGGDANYFESDEAVTRTGVEDQSSEEDDSLSFLLRNIAKETAEPPAPKSKEEVTGQIKVPQELREDTPSRIPSPPPSTEATVVSAKLVCIEGNLDPPEFELGESMTMGRSPSNDVVLKEAKISRQHASIHLKDGRHVLVDLKSSNGVLVNGEKIEEKILENGDEIAIGSYKLIYRSH